MRVLFMKSWDGNGLVLLTLDEFNKLPDGIVLECIDGSFVTKGKDYIDDDTRFGYLAFGIRNPAQHELKELFIEFILES
jgi:hypothetical protein